MNYNSLMNKPTINYKELIGDNTVTEVGGITEEQFNALLTTDLSSYYTKEQIDDLFSRSYVYREKSGSIVTFDCPASVNGIDKVVSEIVAVQSGTGDPSPTNVRPISGWCVVNVVVSPTTDAADGTTYTTTLKDGQGNPMVCYGGALSNENGVQRLDNTDNVVNLSTLSFSYASEKKWFYARLLDAMPPTSNDDIADVSAEIYKVLSRNELNNDLTLEGIALNTQSTVQIRDLRFTDVASFVNAISGYKLRYTLATPTQIPQDSLSIATQEGVNNLWADSGDITVKALDKIIQE